MRNNMNLSGEKRAKVNIGTTLVYQAVAIICGIIVPRMMIKAFGSEAYGITVSITQFLAYISLLEGGICNVARAEFYGGLARGNAKQVGVVYYAVKKFFRWIAAAFIGYTLVLSLLYYDIAHVSAFSRTFTVLLVLAISIATLSKYMGGLTNLTLIAADQRQYVNNLVLIADTMLNTAAVIILINLRCDLLWVKLGSSVVFILRPVLYTAYVKKHYSLPKATTTEKVLAQKWTGLGQHIAYYLHTNIDMILLTLFGNGRLIAIYAVYNLVISSIRAIAQAFSSGMEAAFGRMIARGEMDKLQIAYKKYKVMLSTVSVVLFGCTGILIVPFVKLYTRGITDADYIQPVFAVILLMAEAVNCILMPCTSLPVAANHLKKSRWGAYGEAAINLGISLCLVFWNPLVGVAIGTLVSTVFKGSYYMAYVSRKILQLPLWRLVAGFFSSAVLLCAIIGAGLYAIRGIRIDNILEWTLCGFVVFLVVGTTAAIVMLLQLRALRGKESS